MWHVCTLNSVYNYIKTTCCFVKYKLQHYSFSFLFLFPSFCAFYSILLLILNYRLTCVSCDRFLTVTLIKCINMHILFDKEQNN